MFILLIVAVLLLLLLVLGNKGSRKILLGLLGAVVLLACWPMLVKDFEFSTNTVILLMLSLGVISLFVWQGYRQQGSKNGTK